ncbi:MAG: DUF2357 domain-containing protein [Thermoleophilia bacterium]|nr:DUF2357 domain-containing protein [Thermoleophilia bacterium]
MIVWHEGEEVRVDDRGRLSLQCWATYVIEAEDEIRLPPGLRPELLPRHGDEPYRYRVNFGDYVGRLSLEGLDVAVSSPKLDDEGFDALLRQITSRVAELPFDFSTPAFVPFSRESFEGRDLLYHAFLFLRWAAWYATPSLGELWASVTARPHRQLIREERRTALWEARSVTPRTLERIAADSSSWHPVAGRNRLASTALAQALMMNDIPHLPLEVTEPHTRTCLDTDENRFVKHFIGLAADLVDRAGRLLAAEPSDSALLGDARDLAIELRLLAASDWLSEVGEFERFPVHSQVMQKRFGYREMLVHYLALVLASRYPLKAADITRLVEMKSASLLYEYWTFFEIAESLGALLGRPTEAVKTIESSPFTTKLSEGIKLSFPATAEGLPVELWYNRTFSRKRPTSPSYSVPLRPDITLRVGPELHLFDAKFRVERFEVTENDLADEEVAETRGTVTRGWFKHADIHKMHAYRDAIGGEGQEVSSVWVLYPGTEFAFFAESRKKVDSVRELPRPVRGVGAIPMMPGSAGRGHWDVLDQLIRG